MNIPLSQPDITTAEILVVHSFGVPASMDVILEIAERHSRFVIADACEAIGSRISRPPRRQIWTRRRRPC